MEFSLPDFVSHLADRLEEGQALDVADRSPDLHDGYVDILGHPPDRVLDLVRDVRNDLNRLAQELPFALLFDDGEVDLPRRRVVVFRQPDVGEPLVVPEVQVGLGPVVGDVNLAVLERAHRARIDVDVGIELEEIDADPARLEQGPDGSAGQSLSQR